MEMNIGGAIRRLRQERDITQEELANAIGVTAQAVSKWERAEGYPDITLLPEIAEFFGVSLDTVYGMDEKRNRQEICRIIQSTHDAETYEDALEIAGNGLKKYPQSYELKRNLAESLLGCLGRWTPPQETLEEAIRLYEDIVCHCAEQNLRNDAMHKICRVYELAGQHEKAVDAAKRLPRMRESVEFTLCQVLQGEELAVHVQHSITHMMILLDSMIWDIIGTEHYTAEEKIAVCRKMIAILGIVGERRDWKIGLCWSVRLDVKIAELYLELGDAARCIASLKDAAEHARETDSLRFAGNAESLLLNAIHYEHTDDDKPGHRYIIMNVEENPAFDPIRGRREYMELMAELKGEL